MLGAAWVEYIHDELLHNFWPGTERIGSKGVKNQSLLESAVGRPFQTVFGQDAYLTIIDKAAALFHSLVANHPFYDGNKRTAVTSAHNFLLANGFVLFLGNEKVYELAKSTASYRERGVPHKQAFHEIQNRLAVGTVSFNEVWELSDKGSAELKEMYVDITELRRWIRRSRKNRLIDLP